MLKKLQSNLLLLFFSLLTSLLVAEIVIRFIFPLPVFDYQNTSSKFLFFDCDNEIAWIGKKKVSDKFQRKFFSVHVTHDQYGQRNSVPLIAQDKENIWLLGDSFVWGWGVNDQDTLQANLNELLPNKNIYALAAPGYGTVHEYLLLNRFLELGNDKPDQVAILIINNDFNDNYVGVYENTRHQKVKLTMPKYELENGKLLLRDKNRDCQSFQNGIDNNKQLIYRKKLIENSQLYNLVSAVFYNLMMSSAGVSEQRDPDQEKVNIMALALQQMQQKLAQEKIGFKIFYLDFGHDNGVTLLREKLKNTDLQFIKIHGENFYKEPAVVIPFDGHLTAKGNKILAEIIAKELN